MRNVRLARTSQPAARSQQLEIERRFHLCRLTQVIHAAGERNRSERALRGWFGIFDSVEIGTSNDKIDACGPMGLEELMSYKYVLIDDGPIRG